MIQKLKALKVRLSKVSFKPSKFLEKRGYLRIAHFNAILKVFSKHYLKSVKLTPQLEAYSLYVKMFKDDKMIVSPFQQHTLKSLEGDMVHPSWITIRKKVSSEFYPVFQKIMREAETDLSLSIDYFKLVELYNAMNTHLFEIGNSLLVYISWECRRVNLNDWDIKTFSKTIEGEEVECYSFGSNINSPNCIKAIIEMFEILPIEHQKYFEHHLNHILTQNDIDYNHEHNVILKKTNNES